MLINVTDIVLIYFDNNVFFYFIGGILVEL